MKISEIPFYDRPSERLKKYGGTLLGKGFTEKDYHPAALDYFKKHGIKLGIW